MKQNRENGYYWVKCTAFHEEWWEVSYFSDGTWNSIEGAAPSTILEIDERRITREESKS